MRGMNHFFASWIDSSRKRRYSTGMGWNGKTERRNIMRNVPCSAMVLTVLAGCLCFSLFCADPPGAAPGPVFLHLFSGEGNGAGNQPERDFLPADAPEAFCDLYFLPAKSQMRQFAQKRFQPETDSWTAALFLEVSCRAASAAERICSPVEIRFALPPSILTAVIPARAGPADA